MHPLTYDFPDTLVTLNVWDTAGNPAFACLPDGYYLEADGVIIVASDPNLYQDRTDRICQGALVMVVSPGELNDETFVEMARRLLKRGV